MFLHVVNLFMHLIQCLKGYRYLKNKLNTVKMIMLIVFITT